MIHTHRILYARLNDEITTQCLLTNITLTCLETDIDHPYLWYSTRYTVQLSYSLEAKMRESTRSVIVHMEQISVVEFLLLYNCIRSSCKTCNMSSTMFRIYKPMALSPSHAIS
jgi:hypothetical protein